LQKVLQKLHSMELELDIWYYSEEGEKNVDLGIDKDIPIEKEAELRKVMFYDINAISPRRKKEDEEKEYCFVYNNGDVYVCNKSYEEMKFIMRAKLNSLDNKLDMIIALLERQNELTEM
jgi:hypothetical protein